MTAPNEMAAAWLHFFFPEEEKKMQPGPALKIQDWSWIGRRSAEAMAHLAATFASSDLATVRGCQVAPLKRFRRGLHSLQGAACAKESPNSSEFAAVARGRIDV